MADKRMQPTWDPIAFAAQLRNIARQSQVLMRHFVSHEPDAIKFGMGGRSTLGFDFFELMTRMMTNPVAVASAHIDLFYNMLGIWQKTAERMLLLRAREADTPRDKRFKHPEWSENAIFNFVKDSYLVAAKSILAAVHDVKGMDEASARKVDSIPASSLMRCRLPISSLLIRRSSPQPWRRADRTCCVVWRTFLPIWSAAMAALRLR
jgi:polyhydroxyalkanoate synthase